MKKYIAALLLFMSSCGPVYADRLDTLEAAPDVDYCTISADQFVSAIKAHTAGHARLIKEASPNIIHHAQEGFGVPKDAMYVPEWNSLTEKERGFVEKNVFSGWDEAAKIGRPVTDDEAMMMAQTMFNKCIYDRTKNKRMNFTKTAAIDGAVNVRQKRYNQCKEWLSDHIFIGKAVKSGKDCGQMVEWTTASDVNMERKDKILKLLYEACTAPSVQGWFDKYYEECMGGDEWRKEIPLK